MKCWSPKFWTSLKLDVISMQLLQTVEDSCKNWNKKKIWKYSLFWGENVKICEFFFMFKNIFENDLLNVLMAKLQTIDIYLGHTRLSLKSVSYFLLWNSVKPRLFTFSMAVLQFWKYLHISFLYISYYCPLQFEVLVY